MSVEAVTNAAILPNRRGTLGALSDYFWRRPKLLVFLLVAPALLWLGIVYVGSLTVPLHNAWADAAIAYQKQKYPKMEMLGDRFGVAESLDESIKTTQDQLRAHPDLKGILTFGSQGPIGAARVLDDREKAKSIALVGGFSPGQGVKYVKSGTIRGGFIWNPMTAGEIFVQLASILAAGKEPTDNMELTGVGKVRVYPDKKLIQAQKLESLDKENIDRLVALGL